MSGTVGRVNRKTVDQWIAAPEADRLSLVAAPLAAAIVGGGMAAASHSMKAGGRALINTSPEPFSNWTASIAEDVAVIAGLWIALHYPLLFLVLLTAFIAVLIWLLPKILRGLQALGWRVRRFFGRYSPDGDDGPERLPNNGH